MKQWKKYIAVILVFGLMANHFVVESVVANASDGELYLESNLEENNLESEPYEEEIEPSGEVYLTELESMEEENGTDVLEKGMEEANGEEGNGTLEAITEEGSTGEGSTEEGSTKEGSTEEGSTEEGSTEEGSTGEGSTEEGSTKEGSTEEGSTEEGSTEEGSTGEGSTEEGSTGEDGIEDEMALWSVKIQYDLAGGDKEDGMFEEEVWEPCPITGGYEDFISVWIAEMPPQREGYEFGGWQCSINDFGDTLKPGAELYCTRDRHTNTTIVLTAIWKAVNVNFDFNGGDSENYSVTITNENMNENGIFGIQMPEIVPTYTYYKFVGWLCSEDNVIYDTGSFKEGLNWYDYLEKDITFTAQWVELPVATVQFIQQNGEIKEEVIQQRKEEESSFVIELPADTSNYEGYEFTGWLCEVDGKVYGTDVDTLTMSWTVCANKTVKFTAQWEKLAEVTISYKNDSQVIETVTIRQSNLEETTFDLTLSEVIPEKEYHRFNGWLCSANNSLYPSGGEVSDLSWETYGGSTLTCTAQWMELPVATVQFIQQNGEIKEEVIQQRKEEESSFVIELSADTSKYEGYEFTGWLCEVDGKVYGTDVDTLTMSWTVCANKTVKFTAQWEKLAEVTISYKNDSQVIETVTIRQSNLEETTFDLTLSEVIPEKEYHKFNGWLCSANNSLYPSGGEVSDLSWETYGGSTLTCTAQWMELPTVTIEFVRHDGEVKSEYIRQSKESDVTFEINIPADDSAYDGYVFEGWLCNFDNRLYGTDTQTATFLWEKCANSMIEFTSQWKWDNYSVVDSGEYSLITGNHYYLALGEWKVNDDVYTYSGDKTFYVSRNGNYNFVLQALSQIMSLKEYRGLYEEETKNSAENWSLLGNLDHTVDIYDCFRFYSE